MSNEILYFGFSSYGWEQPQRRYFAQPIQAEFGSDFIEFVFGDDFRSPVGRLWAVKGKSQTYESFKKEFLKLFRTAVGCDYIPTGFSFSKARARY